MRGVVPTFHSPYDMSSEVSTVFDEMLSSWRPGRKGRYDPLHHGGGDHLSPAQWKRDNEGLQILDDWSKETNDFIKNSFTSKRRLAETATLFIRKPFGDELEKVIMKELAKVIERDRTKGIKNPRKNYIIPWGNFTKFMVAFNSKWYLIAIVDLFDENPAEKFQESECINLHIITAIGSRLRTSSIEQYSSST